LFSSCSLFRIATSQLRRWWLKIVCAMKINGSVAIGEGWKLGFDSTTLFGKSLIFKAMTEFNETRRFSKFRKKLRTVFEKPHKSDIWFSSKTWWIKLGFIQITSFTSLACIQFDIGTMNKFFRITRKSIHSRASWYSSPKSANRRQQIHLIAFPICHSANSCGAFWICTEHTIRKDLKFQSIISWKSLFLSPLNPTTNFILINHLYSSI
jgi:hypothetical protein